MKFDKDITKIKRVTFFFETQCRSQRERRPTASSKRDHDIRGRLVYSLQFKLHLLLFVCCRFVAKVKEK